MLNLPMIYHSDMKESIVCSAIWFDDKKNHPEQPVKNGFVACALKHSTCFSTIYTINIRLVEMEKTEGFMTNKNRFVSREEAAKIAYEAGQIREKVLSLNSDDLFE